MGKRGLCRTWIKGYLLSTFISENRELMLSVPALMTIADKGRMASHVCFLFVQLAAATAMNNAADPGTCISTQALIFSCTYQIPIVLFF